MFIRFFNYLIMIPSQQILLNKYICQSPVSELVQVTLLARQKQKACIGLMLYGLPETKTK